MHRKKPQLSTKYIFWQNQEKLAKMVNFESIVIFWQFILIFSETVLFREVFCIAFSLSKPFFWAIKINNRTNFLIFHHKGGPLWFRTSKKLTTLLKMAVNQKQKYFCAHNCKLIKNPDGTACLNSLIKQRITLAHWGGLWPTAWGGKGVLQ